MFSSRWFQSTVVCTKNECLYWSVLLSGITIHLLLLLTEEVTILLVIQLSLFFHFSIQKQDIMIKFLTPVTDGCVTISTSKRGSSCLLKSDLSGSSCSGYRGRGQPMAMNHDNIFLVSLLVK